MPGMFIVVIIFTGKLNLLKMGNAGGFVHCVQ